MALYTKNFVDQTDHFPDTFVGESVWWTRLIISPILLLVNVLSTSMLLCQCYDIQKFTANAFCLEKSSVRN